MARKKNSWIVFFASFGWLTAEKVEAPNDLDAVEKATKLSFQKRRGSNFFGIWKGGYPSDEKLMKHLNTEWEKRRRNWFQRMLGLKLEGHPDGTVTKKAETP